MTFLLTLTNTMTALTKYSKKIHKKDTKSVCKHLRRQSAELKADSDVIFLSFFQFYDLFNSKEI